MTFGKDRINDGPVESPSSISGFLSGNFRFLIPWQPRDVCAFQFCSSAARGGGLLMQPSSRMMGCKHEFLLALSESANPDLDDSALMLAAN